jgi:predicted ATPase
MQADAHILFREITPSNLLSFGPDTPPVPLRALNVLIGPNGSGKSNLIESVALLRATPTDLRSVIRKGGGVTEWIWKGNTKGEGSIEAVVNNPHGAQPIRHVLTFSQQQQAFHLEDERIENECPDGGNADPYFYYRYQRGRPVLNVGGNERGLKRENVETDLSILAQRRDPEAYPEITYLVDTYESIRIYREWSFGRSAVFRQPQQADLRNDRLEEDFSNLGLFLNHLRRQPKAKREMLSALRDLYEGLSDFDVIVEGGTVQVYFTEGDYTVPASRLSDGTLRYLCLLAILCDPQPPPLVCIEEPELGLHPDILPQVADLLKKAAGRTQLIVTTHSDVLVDAMSESPEAVLVCEKHGGQTQIKRLNPDRLAVWLEKYRLGELWTSGELGGTRW